MPIASIPEWLQPNIRAGNSSWMVALDIVSEGEKGDDENETENFKEMS